MEIFFLTFAALIIGVAIMAVGVIFSNKELKGSCGGLGKIMGEDCLFCDKKEECEEHQKKQASFQC